MYTSPSSLISPEILLPIILRIWHGPLDPPTTKSTILTSLFLTGRCRGKEQGSVDEIYLHWDFLFCPFSFSLAVSYSVRLSLREKTVDNILRSIYCLDSSLAMHLHHSEMQSWPNFYDSGLLPSWSFPRALLQISAFVQWLMCVTDIRIKLDSHILCRRLLLWPFLYTCVCEHIIFLNGRAFIYIFRFRCEKEENKCISYGIVKIALHTRKRRRSRLSHPCGSSNDGTGKKRIPVFQLDNGHSNLRECSNGMNMKCCHFKRKIFCWYLNWTFCDRYLETCQTFPSGRHLWSLRLEKKLLWHWWTSPHRTRKIDRFWILYLMKCVTRHNNTF